MIPSLWYEGFNMTATEAFAMRIPVIAPNHAGFPEMISGSGPGFLFTPASVESLKSTLADAHNLGPTEWEDLSQSAYDTYERVFNPASNYRTLLGIYDAAVSNRHRQA